MTEIEQFAPEIYQTLVALPYRVGLYVSLSDMTGGQDSEASEMAALENVVTFYVEDTLKSEFAQEVMLATLQQKQRWSDWRGDIGKVPDECREILGYLEDRIEPRKLSAFKSNLLEIAIAVAMAYRESVEAESFVTKLRNCLSLNWIKKSANSNSQHLNISAAEKIAINALADSFGIDYKVA